MLQRSKSETRTGWGRTPFVRPRFSESGVAGAPALEDLDEHGEALAGAADPRLLAKELCLIMEGAYVTRHVTGDKQSIEFARRVADLVITAGCPQPTANG